jgi:hypothetical protein
MSFEVVDASPLLTLSFQGLSQEVLQGQLLKTSLLLRNDGAAAARNIFIKLSQPSFVFFLRDEEGKGGQILDFYGKSSTLVYLEGISILPGNEIKLEAWLRVIKPGLQKVSLLAIYYPPAEARHTDEPRTSFLSIEVCSNIIS